MINLPRPRRNACSWPPSCHQIFTWVFLIVSGTIFYTSVIPLYPQDVRLYMLGIAIILCTSLLIVFLIASLIDPADPIWLKSYNDGLRSLWRSFAINNKKPEIMLNGDHLRYCHICTVYVHTTSFHCSFCMKCIHNFDHHCLWMNNCVGSQNYIWFMASTILACLTNSFMMLCSLLLVVDSYRTRVYGMPLFNGGNHSFYHPSSYFKPTFTPAIHWKDHSVESAFPSYQVLFINCSVDTWLSIVILNLLIFAVVSFVLFLMVFFHLYLKIKNLSTLQFLRVRRMKLNRQDETPRLIHANPN